MWKESDKINLPSRAGWNPLSVVPLKVKSFDARRLDIPTPICFVKGDPSLLLWYFYF